MNLQINQLVRSLLKKDDIGQCSLQELQQFAEKNPYFGAAQLLLTKKMQTDAPAQYDEQLQKTFLFFNNPLWVEQVLNGTGRASVVMPEKKPEPVTAFIPPPVEETVMEMIPVEPIVKETELTEPVITIEETTANEPAVEEIVLAEPVMQTESEPVIEEPVAQTQEPVLQIPVLNIEQPSSNTEPAKEELLFEPYHTVDYFASQGIKFKEDEKPKDKFGQQLKSFTDWLKSMKRLPISEITKTVEAASPANAEKKVEQLAEHSLTEGDVVTEAMAEVWEKQGNAEKAIEVYQKLSLLDPSKSPYFAAKISALNK